MVERIFSSFCPHTAQFWFRRPPTFALLTLRTHAVLKDQLVVAGTVLEVHPRVGLIRVRVRVRPAGELLRQRRGS